MQKRFIHSSQLRHVHFLPARIDYSKFLKVLPLNPKPRFCAQDSCLLKTNEEANIFLVRPTFEQQAFSMTHELKLSHRKSVNFPFIPLSTITPQRKHRFSSDHRSQALSGEVSTWTIDRLGIPRVVGYSFCSLFVLVAVVEITLLSLPFSIEIYFCFLKEHLRTKLNPVKVSTWTIDRL